MSDLTFARVEAEVRRLVSENPDYVYPMAFRCFYLPDSPGNDCGESCLIGVALLNLGVDRGVLARFEQESASAVMKNGLGIALACYQSEWLDVVQDKQDRGKPWLHAVEKADQCLADAYGIVLLGKLTFN